jgi:hypothetical protein
MATTGTPRYPFPIRAVFIRRYPLSVAVSEGITCAACWHQAVIVGMQLIGARPRGLEANPRDRKLDGRLGTGGRQVGRLGAEAKISASEAWPSEVRSFLGPTSKMPQAASQSRGRSAPTAAMSAQRLRETISPHMSPGSILQPRVPGRSPTLAAKTSRRAVSADHQRSRKTPSAEPTTSVQPRFRPAGRGSSDQPAVNA